MVQRVALWCMGVLLVGAFVCFHPPVTEAKLPRASAAEVSTVQAGVDPTSILYRARGWTTQRSPAVCG